MKRDFTYVDDIVDGIIKLITALPTPNPLWNGDNPDSATSFAPYKLYNIGNNQPVELLDFIKVIENKLGKKAIINFMPLKPGDVPATYAFVDDLINAVGFKSNTPIEQGIAALI
jgi:UDP-glucuronate 4-epimerase